MDKSITQSLKAIVKDTVTVTVTFMNTVTVMGMGMGTVKSTMATHINTEYLVVSTYLPLSSRQAINLILVRENRVLILLFRAMNDNN